MERQQDHFTTPNTNRVAEALFDYAADEAKLKIHNPIASHQDTYDIELKLNYFTSLAKAYSKTKNRAEKKSLVFVRHEIRKLKAKLQPTRFNRFYYSDIMEAFKNWLRGKSDPVTFYQQSIKKLEIELIQNHNLQSLTAQLKKAGFNVEMEGSLRRMINQNLSKFHLRYADIENASAHYVVHFKKIPETDLYYFEKFETISRPSLDALLKKDPNCKRQTFYMQDDLKIYAGEAAKLVNGISICKRVEGIDQWLLLDRNTLLDDQVRFVQFDIEKALEKLPILERDSTNKYQLILGALKNGNRKEATLFINGEHLNCKLEANPQRKEIHILDEGNRLLDIDRVMDARQAAKNVFQKVEEHAQDQDQRQGLRMV